MMFPTSAGAASSSSVVSLDFGTIIAAKKLFPHLFPPPAGSLKRVRELPGMGSDSSSGSSASEIDEDDPFAALEDDPFGIYGDIDDDRPAKRKKKSGGGSLSLGNPRASLFGAGVDKGESSKPKRGAPRVAKRPGVASAKPKGGAGVGKNPRGEVRGAPLLWAAWGAVVFTLRLGTSLEVDSHYKVNGRGRF